MSIQSEINRISGEVETQEDLIAQIAAALEGKAGGGASAPNLQPVVVTPSAEEQMIQPGDFGNYNGFSSVLVEGDEDLVPGNIKSGVSIFGVNGSYEGEAAEPTIGKVSVKPNSNSTSIAFSGLSGEPKMFAICPTGNITLGSTRYVTGVMFDGTTTRGTYGYRSGSSATSYHSASYFTWTYSNGTLTVRTSSSSNGGNFTSSTTYQLTYIA